MKVPAERPQVMNVLREEEGTVKVLAKRVESLR